MGWPQTKGRKPIEYTAEVSGHVTDFNKAFKYAKDHNQQSILNWAEYNKWIDEDGNLPSDAPWDKIFISTKGTGRW